MKFTLLMLMLLGLSTQKVHAQDKDKVQHKKDYIINLKVDCIPKTEFQLKEIIARDPVVKSLQEKILQLEAAENLITTAEKADLSKLPASAALKAAIENALTEMRQTRACPRAWVDPAELKSLGYELYIKNKHLQFNPGDFAPNKNAFFCGNVEFLNGAAKNAGVLTWNGGQMTSFSQEKNLTRVFEDADGSSRIYKSVQSSDGLQSYREVGKEQHSPKYDAAGDHVYFKLARGVYLDVTGRVAGRSFATKHFYGAYLVITDDFMESAYLLQEIEQLSEDLKKRVEAIRIEHDCPKKPGRR